MPSPIVLTHDAWMEEGRRRFGDDFQQWKFVCPICDHVASIADYEKYKDKGATPNSATCECIGRYSAAPGAFKGKGVTKGQGPCDYAGYGLFRLSPVHIVRDDPAKPTHCFAFAEAAGA